MKFHNRLAEIPNMLFAKISRNSKVAPVLIFVLAFGVRALGIFTRPIWYDEAFAILFSEKDLAAMLYGTLSRSSGGTADIHPLGYYTLLWAWMKVFGQSIPSARLFSIVIGLASLVLIYRIACILFNRKTAIFAVGLTSILPFQVHFAQEIRMYSLLSFWLLLATFAFLRGQTGNWKWWILFGSSSALAQYTHNLAAIYLIPLALTPFFQRDTRAIKSLVPASVFALFLYLPWLIHLPAQFSKVNSAYWVERPGVEKVFTLFLFYLPHLPLPDAWLLPGVLISTLIVTLAVYQTFLAWRRKLPGQKRGLWLAYLAFMPPLLLWGISQFVSVYIERALLPSHAIFCIWLAWVLTQTGIPKPIQVFTLGLVVSAAMMGLFQHLTYAGFPYGDFSALNQRIAREYQPDDVIVHSNKLSYMPAFYFNPELPQGYIIDPVGGSTDTLATATQEVLRVQPYNDIQTAIMDKKRIWFIIYQQSVDEYTAVNKTHPHLEYLNENFTLDSIESMGDLRIYIYTRNVD